MADDSTACDVNVADEAKQRRLERHPEFGHAGAVLAGARPASDVKNQWLAIGVCVACSILGRNASAARAAMPFVLMCVALEPSPFLTNATTHSPNCVQEMRAASVQGRLLAGGCGDSKAKKTGGPGGRYPCDASSVRKGNEELRSPKTLKAPHATPTTEIHAWK